MKEVKKHHDLYYFDPAHNTSADLIDVCKEIFS